MRAKILVLTATATLVIAACGTDTVASTTTDGEPATTTTAASDEVVQIPHRVLLDGFDGGGRPWTTGHVTSEEELTSLAPDASVDWASEVVFRFTLAESGSCPFDDMQGLVLDRPHLRIYPVVTLAGDPEVCTDDANPHTIVVAVSKSDLPDGDFSIWVGGDEPSSGVTDGMTGFGAGELTAPDELAVLAASGELAVGETRIAHDVTSHCGLDRIFRPIDGRQWILEDYDGDEIDYIPPGWEPAVDGEQIDLIIERVGTDGLLVTAVGTDVGLAFVPAADETGCD